jgi:Ni,Fe-hydrogenase III small subunit
MKAAVLIRPVAEVLAPIRPEVAVLAPLTAAKVVKADRVLMVKAAVAVILPVVHRVPGVPPVPLAMTSAVAALQLPPLPIMHLHIIIPGATMIAAAKNASVRSVKPANAKSAASAKSARIA